MNMNISHSREVILTVQKKCDRNANAKRISTAYTNSPSVGEVETSEQAYTILCVLWKSNTLGAAYFKTNDQQLYVLQEMVDFPPQFAVTQSLYCEVDPTHLIVIGSTCDNFVKFILGILANEVGEDKDSNTTESINSRAVPSNLFLLNLKEFSFQNCELKVYNLKLPSEPENATSVQKEVFLHSRIDFDCKMSVHSLGALIKYMEQNWSHFSPNEKELKFLDVKQISMENRVLIDRNTFNSLQIFQKEDHSSNYKQCRDPNGSEKYSIFRLLSQYCKSKPGYYCLRNILRNPLKDLNELNKRLDFIEFALIPGNQGFIESLQENIKKIFEVHTILRKIQYGVANSNHWEMLYNTIFNALFLHELCGPYRKSSSLLNDLNNAVTAKLYEVQFCIYSALDFTQSNKQNRPIIKFGLDDELDAKELKKQDIAKIATAAAQIAVNQLPDYLNECSVVYIPEMGHFVAIIKWEVDCNKNALESYGFHFAFETNDCLHYKNPMCYGNENTIFKNNPVKKFLELDKQLGNIHLDILAHQNRIIQRLTDLVLRYNKDIREPLKIIGFIDCLISISRVAKEKDYVRPNLSNDSIQEITKGRHPLLELLNTNFVSNDILSGGNYSRIKILTGPNNSGKSVFLKQTALIIYMAHIGCYVPADKANIGVVHSIHSRMYGTESAGVSLSAFMLDLSQTSQSLYNTTSSSLVLIDEFGKGTLEDDGLALLVGVLEKFSNEKESSPHVIVSTHLQQISQFLPASKFVSYMKMDHEKRNTGELIYLYKVVEGISNSFAFDVANASGLDNSVIQRAKELYHKLSDSKILSEQDRIVNSVPSNLFDIHIPEPND